jgi:hypothetical protein
MARIDCNPSSDGRDHTWPERRGYPAALFSSDGITSAGNIILFRPVVKRGLDFLATN